MEIGGDEGEKRRRVLQSLIRRETRENFQKDNDIESEGGGDGEDGEDGSFLLCFLLLRTHGITDILLYSPEFVSLRSNKKGMQF